MAHEKVADMTIEELKAVIAEVVAQQSKPQSFGVAKNLEMPKQPDQAHAETNQKAKTSLPKRTKAEQRAKNQALIGF